MNRTLPPLLLNRPLREVRLAPASPYPHLHVEESRGREREAAAYERGRRDGRQALDAELLEQRRELVNLQTGVFESLRQTVPQVLRDSEQALVALALEVTRKLVSGLPVTAEWVEAGIKEALAQVEETTEFHIYLHPEDLDLLKQIDCDLLSGTGHSPYFHFHPTPEVARGGSMVKTRFGILDATRENKMEILKQAILS
jgi:flagellar biosynthesis/type III secretory pathway protein FliH